MHIFFETACREGELADVLFFLSKGYPVNACNAAGMSALMIAADTGQMALSLLLLRFGANVDLTSASDQSASMIAQARGHVMLAKLLCGKPERRLMRPKVPSRVCPDVGQAALVLLLEYGVHRGFLSDAQIYKKLPALRDEPTGFSVVCQALQSLGIVLRDRTPNLDRFAQPVRVCSDVMALDLNEFAHTIMNKLRSETGRRHRVAYTYSQPAVVRPLMLKSQKTNGSYREPQKPKPT